jgi:hypothetical protein
MHCRDRANCLPKQWIEVIQQVTVMCIIRPMLSVKKICCTLENIPKCMENERGQAENARPACDGAAGSA